MEEIREKCLPGTALPYTDQGVEAFASIDALISVTGGLSLSQVCAITGLEGSTIQNWVKRGWVSNPRGKKYSDNQLARIIIINALKECIKLESIAQLISYISGSGGDESIVSERELFNYLCQALRTMGRSDDLSGGSIEAVVDELTVRYEEGTRFRLRRALTVMIYACVCSDVKRRTEMMLGDILPQAGADPDGPREDESEPAAYTDEPAADEPVEGESAEDEPEEEEEAQPETVSGKSGVRSWFARRS